MSIGAGQWRRAGMEGFVTGLDLASCRARLTPPDGDPAAILELLALAEGGAVKAMAARKPDGET